MQLCCLALFIINNCKHFQIKYLNTALWLNRGDMTVICRLRFNQLQVHHLYTYMFYNRTGSCEFDEFMFLKLITLQKKFCTKWNKEIFSLQEISLSPSSVKYRVISFCMSKLDIQ